METDLIEQQIDIAAPLARVWRALIDHGEFGAWFGVAMEAPFAAGRSARGQITYPGFEHLSMEVLVQQIRPETYFSFTWHPFAIEAGVDYSQELPTLVEFFLEPVGGGTRVKVKESGFDRIPPHRRDRAFLANQEGWTEQMQNIRKYVADQ